MNVAEKPRTFEAKPAARGEEPLLIGMVGPPGGGKTYSALRCAKGMQALRGGDIVLIDTEGGRAKKYADEFKFLHVDFDPPHQPHAFLDAIKQQLARKPACIIVDSMSDEHEGAGGYLEWHDEMVPKMSGNEWAAWAKPKASRKRLIVGILQIKTPLIFTFRAREKTQAKKNGNKTEIVNIGWMPVAPLEIVHSLDLTCILPPRAEGVPVWESSKIGEDFIVKLPSFLAPLIQAGALSETTGRALAAWARGDTASPPVPGAAGSTPSAATPSPAEGGTTIDHDAEFIEGLDKLLATAADGGVEALKVMWDKVPKTAQKQLKASLDRRHKPRAAEVDSIKQPA